MGQPPSPTSVVILSMHICAVKRTNLYDYIHFYGFFTPNNAFAAGAPPRIPLGDLPALTQTLLLMGTGLAASSTITPPPLSAFGLDYRPFGPQSPPPNSNLWLRLCPKRITKILTDVILTDVKKM